MQGLPCPGQAHSITLLLLHGLLLLLPSPASLTVSYVTPKWTIAALEQRANYQTKGLFRSCHWRAESKGHIPFRVSPCCISLHFSTYLWRLRPTHLSPSHALPPQHSSVLRSLFSTTAWWSVCWLRESPCLQGLFGCIFLAKP